MSTEELAGRIWNNGQPLKGSLGETYLAGRALALPKTENLRFVASLPHKSGVSYPAIIARVDRVDGVMMSIQRTFLAHDGAGKAPVPKGEQKMSLGPTRGGMVRLAGLKDGVPLIIGEGVETALTVMQATGLPCWASLGTSGLKAADLQAAIIARLAMARCDAFFHDENREAYAIMRAPHDGGVHREVHRLKTKGFREWLLLVYFDSRNDVPNDNSIRSAIALLGAIARYRGERREAFVRRAFDDGKLYIDLCDDRWRAIEVLPSTDGKQDNWRMVDEPPVLFLRAPGMLALPEPKRCDPKRGIALLQKQMRARTNSDFVIIVAFMLDALGGRGPHAVLFFTGESGSTKTTHTKMVRMLTDPNARPVRSKPKELRDVYVAAIKSGMVVYNNLSSLPDWLSDVFCVITEGSADSRRELFTDDEESVIFARAPVILAAISNIVTQGDLGARTLYSGLAPVPDSERKTEPELWKEFNEAAPEILGALLTGLSTGLRRWPTIKVTLPRMATFAQFAMGCETTYWPEGTFAAAYEVNARNAVADALEANIAVSTFRDFMEDRPDGKWKGTATQLHAALTERIRKPEHDALEAHKKAVASRDPDLKVLTEAKLREAQQAVRDVMSSGWPKKPDGLTHELRKAGPQLRKIGIAITWPTNNRDRELSIIWQRPRAKTENSGSQASQASQTETSSNENNGLSGKPSGSPQPQREALSDFDPQLVDENENAGESADSEGREALSEKREAPGKPFGQTEYANNHLNQQGNYTGREAPEVREAECGDSHTRSHKQTFDGPPDAHENQKRKAKPPKRIIPL